MSNKAERLQHSCFPQPEDSKEKVWRYLDLAKFINLISNNSLYFARIDLLNDIYEGSLTKPVYLAREEATKNRRPTELTNEKRALRMRKTFYVNCWRIDKHESEAMWKLYCPENEGIAIQTTYDRLVTSLPEEDEIYIGSIKYIDYEKDKFNGNAFSPMMHKRKAFEHEKEIRLIKPLMQYWNTEEPPSDQLGISVPWDFKIAVENIYVNPYAKEWYYETIKTLAIHYELNLNIEWSSLKSSPHF